MNRKVSWKLIAILGLPALMSAQTLLTPFTAGNAMPRSGGSSNLNPAPAATGGPQIIPLGSSLTFGGTNAPDTYSAATTFSSTPVLVDNGAVKIWQEQVPTGANGEWDIFHMVTASGGPVAGNINAYWNVVMNYTLSAAVVFDAVVQQWMVNGAGVSPITNGIGSICCAATSNPILPGDSYYNSGFAVPYPAGLFTNWQQVYVTPYSLVSAGGINPSTANGFTFALHFTLQPAAPTVTAVIGASQYGAFPTFGPGSWIEIYGTNFAVAAREWGQGDFNGVNAPTKLGGTSVTIGGQSAFVEYISPGQVNAQVPAGVTTGAQPLIVTTAAGSSAPFTVNVVTTEPGLLAAPAFKIGGIQYAEALFSDNVTYVLPPGAISGIASQRAKPGDTITLYGVGFGPVSTFIEPGQVAEGSSTLAAPFTVSFGGTPATVTYDGLAPTFVGLYQFDVVVPAIAAGDAVPLTFTLGGVSGTQTLAIAVGN